MRIDPFPKSTSPTRSVSGVDDPPTHPNKVRDLLVSGARLAGRGALAGARLALRGARLGARGAVAGARMVGRLARKQPKIAAGVAGVLVAACVGLIIATQGVAPSSTQLPPPPPAIVNVVAESAPAGSSSYVVQPGDTLFGIAQRYGISTEQLAAANGIADPNLIQVGTVLVLPGSQPAPAPVAVVDDVRGCYNRYFPEALGLAAATGYDANLLTGLTCYSLQPGVQPRTMQEWVTAMQSHGIAPGAPMATMDSMQQQGVLGNERAVVQAFYEIYRDYAQ